MESPSYDDLNQSKENIYDLEFFLTAEPSKDIIYQNVDASIFKKFLLKSVSMKNLGLKKIEANTFGLKCCQNTLESINLSGNKLSRFDSYHLVNLKYLERIDLSNNNIQVSDGNFKYSRNLRVINLSGNQIQYLPYKIFDQLNELEFIDLSNNSLHNIDACTFNRIQVNLIKIQNSPARVSLFNNPLECDCDLFYLNRHLNLILNLTCSRPNVYTGKRFEDLKQEDLSFRCQYKKMETNCSGLFSSISFKCIVVIILTFSGECLCALALCRFCKKNNEKTSQRHHANNYQT